MWPFKCRRKQNTGAWVIEGLVAYLDTPTTDHRLISSEGFHWRTTPMPLMMTGGGERSLVGTINEVEIRGREVWVHGFIMLSLWEPLKDRYPCGMDLDSFLSNVDELSDHNTLLRISHGRMMGITVYANDKNKPAFPGAHIQKVAELA